MVSVDDRSGLTRRTLLGAGATVAAGLALAGCGSDSQPAGGTTTPAGSDGQPAGGGSPAASAAPKQGGTFRVAAKTFAEATACDPHQANTSYSINNACFDALVESDHDNKWRMAMAEKFEMENNDPTQWLIKLKAGMKWHDGKPVTADDVIFTINRIMDPKAPLAAATMMKAIDLNGITKVDDLTVRLKLKSPDCLMLQSFSQSFSCLVPVGFDPAKPVGSGPFTFESFTPKQRWVGNRFADYWRGAGLPHLDRLELVGFASPTAALNGLLAGQVDGLDKMLPAQLQQVKQRPNLITTESQTGSIMQVSMNCRKGAPFEDARVRKAFKLMLDRQQLINSVYAGHGKIGNDVGVFPEWDDACDPALPEPQHDVEQAKTLLQQAGKENMTVTLRVAELVTGMTAAAQVIQEQAKKIGVTVKLDVVADIATFYTDAYYGADLQIDWTDTIDMRAGCGYYWLTESDYNAGGYSNAEVDKLHAEALASTTPEGYKTAMRKLSTIIQEDGPWLVWGRTTQIDAHTDKFTGVQQDAGGTGLNGCFWYEISAV